MTKMKTILAATVAAATFVAAPAGAATLLVNAAGLLTGATGVTIGGKTYDVAFKDGTCAQVYGACANASLDFTSAADAFDAASALRDQVFNDGPAGRFDTAPSLTLGCENINSCATFVGWDVSTRYVSGAFFSNAALESNDGVYQSSVERQSDLTADSRFTYARFTLTSSAVTGAVPEPATWAMMLIGFGAMGASLRTRRRAAKIAFA